MKVKFKFRHIRKKNWDYGSIYPFPTIAFTWENDTPQFAVCLIWLSMRFDIWFIRKKDDLVGLMKQVFDINDQGGFGIINPSRETRSQESSGSSRH